jgi:alkylhydroperoxidase family enzyme
VDRVGLGTRLERLSIAAMTLTRAVLGTPATTPVDVRRAAFDGSHADAALADYVALVEQHAYRLTDARLSVLRNLGLSDDAIFEVTVAAALGAAQRRLDFGVALLETSADS